ncbi:MAG TPA: DegT/DnrJ/EryC1/StrS family aminotransferase [Acidimicrobiia bacterium]|nr:DegT/DnrJ/EryC1/StrS family aminotransferase [Acidimicrobiia bacterium]
MAPRVPVMRPWLGEEEALAVAEALRSGWIAQGPRVAAFEAAFAETIGAEAAVAVSSCTAALHLALVVGGVGAGDDVVVPSLSFIATANAPTYVGARPVFADVDPCSQNVTPETVDAALTPATRAVVVVHQVGMPADLDGLHALCDPRGILVVEDAACAIGSTYHGDLIGTGSDLVTFSFHPRKLLTTGEGGMLVSRRADWAARARALREHGMSVSAAARHASDVPMAESYLEVGFNYRMTDLQAAVGLVQLGKLDAMVAHRREQAARYQKLLAEASGIGVPHDPPWGTTNYQSFSIALPEDVDRDAVMARLLADGISTRRGVMAAHLEPAYADRRVSLPVTERLVRSSLILPLYQALEPDEQAWVVERLVAALADRPAR